MKYLTMSIKWYIIFYKWLKIISMVLHILHGFMSVL